MKLRLTVSGVASSSKELCTRVEELSRRCMQPLLELYHQITLAARNVAPSSDPTRSGEAYVLRYCRDLFCSGRRSATGQEEVLLESEAWAWELGPKSSGYWLSDRVDAGAIGPLSRG